MLAGLSYTFLGDKFCMESQFLQDLLSPLVSAPFCSLLAGTSVARLVTERLVTSLSEGCKTDRRSQMAQERGAPAPSKN